MTSRALNLPSYAASGTWKIQGHGQVSISIGDWFFKNIFSKRQQNRIELVTGPDSQVKKANDSEEKFVEVQSSNGNVETDLEGCAISSVSTYMTDRVEIFKSAMINLDQVGPKSLVKTVLMYGTRPMLQAMDSMYQVCSSVLTSFYMFWSTFSSFFAMTAETDL